MRAVIQRVSEASVTVAGQVVGQIGRGLLVLLGVGHADGPGEAQQLAAKIAAMRIFPDDDGRFNRSVLDVGGAVLVVSQFTLYADTRRGRRPGFSDAAPPELAAPLVDTFADALRAQGLEVALGRFGAHMQVALVNDGPVTIMLDTATSREARSLH
ncbi:MAG: D-tyrosyl-tRNA(Tyr) deacylase [Chloroflexi bacterium SZAS-1]|jgi:D-tyrosyl-tRNA(Tyr) deacylase|nr:D-tyrosyl-tRNA(Tyr) deacylase [Chloroflexi bacterium SZAS-1]